MTLEAKEYEFDNVIEDVKKVSEKSHGYFQNCKNFQSTRSYTL